MKNNAPDFDKDIAGFTKRQLDACYAMDSGRFKYLLYGGCLGGGKSYWIRWSALRRLMILHSMYGISNAVGMIACEDYPALKDRQISKISIEFPPWIGKFHSDHKIYGKSFIMTPEFGSGVIVFRNLDDTSKYQSAEFAFIFVDELTKNTYETFTFLRSRLRWPGLHDTLCIFAGGTNPGSVGHGWVKALFLDGIFGDEWSKQEHLFTYIPSKAKDNPFIDASYYTTLDSLPENLRKAFRDGDWNVFVGQAFPEFNIKTHVLDDNPPIPESAPLYMSFDWGFGKPFSVGWWYTDTEGRLYRFAEWYGWNGTPDVGLRISDTEIKEGIIEMEKTLGIWGRTVSRVAGHDCFAKKPDYKGGGQGPSTFETFAIDESNKGEILAMRGGDPMRPLKIRQFRERLRVPIGKDKKPTGERPMLMVYERCSQFKRTIPNLVMDQNNIEDVNTKSEDHIYDEASLMCMDRPIKLVKIGMNLDGVTERLNQLASPQATDPMEQFERDHIKRMREHDPYNMMQGGMSSTC